MANLHFLRSLTDTINTSFILESGETRVVVDGGFPSEAPHLYEYLKGLGGHVDAWFLTHFHDDHFGAFVTILQEHPDITVDKVYCCFPSDEFIVKGEPKQTVRPSAEWITVVRETLEARGMNVVRVQTGDVFDFDGGRVTVRVLRTPDESITVNPINNSSCVYRFETDGKSILFLGDLGAEASRQLLDTVPPELLRADYLQMAHHGQNGVSRECYEAIRPTYCLWPTPSWLWDNMGPNGYDTGAFQTVIVRGWISGLRSVKRHYRMTEGDHVIRLDEA